MQLAIKPVVTAMQLAIEPVETPPIEIPIPIKTPATAKIVVITMMSAMVEMTAMMPVISPASGRGRIGRPQKHGSHGQRARH